MILSSNIITFFQHQPRKQPAVGIFMAYEIVCCSECNSFPLFSLTDEQRSKGGSRKRHLEPKMDLAIPLESATRRHCCVVQIQTNPRAGIFPGAFFLWEKQNVDLLKTKLFMARIISVKLPGWQKMKVQQSFQTAVMSCFDLLRKGNFRRFA